MRSLEEMCHILNRWLELDEANADDMLAVQCPCHGDALLNDHDIIVHVGKGSSHLTPMSLINSLVQERREDGKIYGIFRDVNERDGKTINFFVAAVERT